MRVHLRAGYVLIRDLAGRQAVIPGPRVLDITEEEFRGQSHKFELLAPDPEPAPAPQDGAGGAPDSPADPKPSPVTEGGPERFRTLFFPPPRACPACGSELSPGTRGSEKRFCSPKCRRAAWRKRGKAGAASKRLAGGLSIVDALRDPKLFGSAFPDVSTWRAWRAFLKALFALPLDDGDLELFRRHTGRSRPPSEPMREAWVVVGRRGGKSRVAALVAVFVACFRDYSRMLAPGERGVVMLLAADRKQARTLLRYVTGLLDGSPVLSSMVRTRLKETISLTNGLDIEIHTSNYRSVRGYTVVACVADEIAFWRDEESVNPDTEVLNAIRPAMATVPGSLLVAISSPYARKGALWTAYAQHFGKNGDPVLVWQAATREMNPSVQEHVIEEALVEDESAARAEWLAEFRTDIESFITREAVEACVVPSRFELPPQSKTLYFGFVDPSGGASDSMTLAIAHRNEGESAVLDLVREVRAPFSPELVVQEFAEILKRYPSMTYGDRYGAEWVRERFMACGISYQASPKDRSALYVELLPLLNSRKAELLDNRRLIAQLVSLERRTARSGKDSIDHAPGRHDDLANAAAGALVLAASDEYGLPRIY